MLKKWLDVILFSGTIPVGVLFFYSLPLVFSAKNQEEYIHSISIAMLMLMLLGILIVLIFFTNAFSGATDLGRIKSLLKRKVYTFEGDYVGIVKDVILIENKIYGLKIVLKGNKKMLIKTGQVKKFGEVVLINIPLDKVKSK